MGEALSQNERDALARFIAKVIGDVEKVADLFESRGADATLPRAAQANLQATLDRLQDEEMYSMQLHACVPDNY